MVPLTEEQQHIIQHTHGPALVFAVAGAGKTTCLTQRLVRLVQEGHFRPSRMLATSFSRESVRDIQNKLSPHPFCKSISVKTLHGVGYAFLKKAVQLGLIPAFTSEKERDGTKMRLLRQALRQVRIRGVVVPDTFDTEDFFSYMGHCKASLHYADHAEWDFPDEAGKSARQAEAPLETPYYLDLYQAFEKQREKENFVTFDDMVLLAWDLAVKNPQLMQEVESRYDCVLVDEFQDLNLAQSEFLHLLVRKHQNIMALGDDDQTIYSWRGSSPQFIRSFQQRYGARKYHITQNFRSFASQLALANFVIGQNQDREPKVLNLTRGFGGHTSVQPVESQFEMARDVVEHIQQGQQQGRKLQDHAILVRTYALTPFIETELIEAGLPYQILGGSHFHKRDEIRVLLSYLRVALLLHAQLQAPLDLAHHRTLRSHFAALVGVPRRYIPQQYVAVLMGISLGANDHGEPGPAVLHQLLKDTTQPEYSRFQAGLQALHHVLEQLVHMVGREVPAHVALDHLIYWINYESHLRGTTADPELAEARVLGVGNLIRYAENRGSIEEFLKHMDLLSLKEAALEHTAADQVLITTPYRAKGLEWPVVFVPGLNEGTLPMQGSETDPALLEEERRVLYVAITRAREQLHLYHLQKADAPPISRFLLNLPEAGQQPEPGHRTHQEVLQEVQEVTQALHKPPADLNLQDAHALLHHVQVNHFGRYITGHAYRHFDLDHMMELSEKVLGAAAAVWPTIDYPQASLQPWESYGQEPAHVKFTSEQLGDLLKNLHPGAA